MMSLLKCAQCGHMGAAYSMNTTLALGSPMVMSWAVIGSLAGDAAAALSPAPPRKYQALPPAISATTTLRMIQVLRDMRFLYLSLFCSRLAAPRNFLNGRCGYRLRARASSAAFR